MQDETFVFKSKDIMILLRVKHISKGKGVLLGFNGHGMSGCNLMTVNPLCHIIPV